MTTEPLPRACVSMALSVRQSVAVLKLLPRLDGQKGVELHSLLGGSYQVYC